MKKVTKEGKVDYLISRDKKHLLVLKEFEGIRIISPEEEELVKLFL